MERRKMTGDWSTASSPEGAHGKKPNVVLVKALLAFAAPNGAKIKATAYYPSPIRLSTEWVASLTTLLRRHAYVRNLSCGPRVSPPIRPVNYDCVKDLQISKVSRAKGMNGDQVLESWSLLLIDYWSLLLIDQK
nr:hypothetical protein Iba_chr08bCG8860 [Ipomoea batatas]